MCAEREELKIKLSAVELASGEDWETERRENSIVRERINDLAAKVTAMAAALEGPDSPINAALAEDEKETKAKKAHGTAAAKAKKDVETLADRIRALQEASE